MNTNEVEISQELLRFWAAAGRNVEKRSSGTRSSHLDATLSDIYDPPQSPVLEEKLPEEFSWTSCIRSGSLSSAGDSDDYSEGEVQFSPYGTCYVRSGECLVSGDVIKDVPGVHYIQGLQEQELPVIATYVYPTITPGFKYRVRPADGTKCLFDGKALPLMSIGKGYGKRITFASESKNYNDNYFYSDTNSEGYGFQLELVSEGTRFTIYDDSNFNVGEATVTKVLEPELELSHQVLENGGTMKRSQVNLLCEVTDYGESDMTNRRCVMITAIAVAVKGRKSPEATLKKLVDCTFNEELGFTLTAGVDRSNRPVVVSGEQIDDVPTKYSITGIQENEFPAVGTYVDTRIIPGFKYRVRPLDSKKHFFDGKALTLQSIGRGYAKRFTFCNDVLNYNDNFFWSDSNSEGFGFSLEAVAQRDTFSVMDMDGSVLGKVQVYRADAPQVEESMQIMDGDVIKRVRVSLTCDFSLNGHPDVTLPITGTAILIKKKGERTGKVQKIKDIATDSQLNYIFSSRVIFFLPL